jgi:hypothetical protein
MKYAQLFRLLSRRWVTVQDSIRLCGVSSLSQAVTRMEREDGIAFDRQWRKAGTSRFLAYRLAKGKT